MINTSSAILHIENVAYEYVSTREGVYVNKLGPDLLTVNSGYVLTDTVHRRELYFDKITLRLQSIKSLTDSSRLEMQYDDYLSLVRVRHSNGGYMDVVYDSKNRITVIQTKNDTVIGHKTILYSYHETKNLLMSATVNKETTYYDYDENMNLVAVHNADGSVFTAAYSKEGFLTNKTYTLRDGTLQELTQFSYDHVAVVNVSTYPEETSTLYTFDENAEVIAMKKVGSPTVKFIKTVSSKFIVASDRVLQSTIYDKDKQTVRIEDANGDSITIMYGSSEDMEAFYDGGVPYLYDVEYKYDQRGNLIEVWDKITSRKLLTVGYDSRGRVFRKILGNGAKTEYQYNQQTGFLEALFNYHVNGTLSTKFEYVYDTYQRRIKLHTVEGTYKFQYDSSGQLTMVENPLGVITEYSYDNRKNRIKVRIDGKESLYTVNMLNEYERYGDMTFEYDKNGNLIKKIGTKTKKLFYNEDNQLLSIETPTVNCSLVYDALGSLESLNSTDAGGRSSQRHYLTDLFGPYGSDVLMQIYINGTDTKVTSYFHGADQLGLIAMRMDDDYFYFQFDPIGSVVMILSSSEDLNSYNYDTFGLVTKSKESINNPFKFVGQWGVMQIPEIPELYFMRARFYDAEIGRFLSVDPIGIEGMSKNLYVYAYNNPVHLRDPNGKLIYQLFRDGVWNVGKYLLKGNDITWGGATKAFIDGAVDSAISEVKTANIIGKLFLSIEKGLYHTVTSAIQHKIDHTPYDWDQFWHDFDKNILSEIKSTIQDSFWDLIPEPIQSLVDLGKDIYEVCQERTDNCRPVIDAYLSWIRSHDPNDIISPVGYGAAKFVAKDTVLKYTIRFENDENATASAQRVFIEHTFDEDLDLRSFRLGSYGFGNFTKELSFQSSTEQTTVNLTKELGIFIRVVAGVDFVKKQATWEFQAIDMVTGLPPTNVSKGFLPPNNGTSGQGFVHFSIKVKADAPTLSRIDANATIYFDQNDPIDTRDVFNTIDDSAPSVKTTVIKDALSEGILVLSFNSTDVGAGVQEINLYSREVEGYILLKAGIKESLTSLNLNKGKNYTLLPLPVDYVGNRPQIKDTTGIQLVLISIPQSEDTCSCSGHGNCSGSICSCDAGYYGSSCNETVRPQYPPMLEVRVIDGYEDEPLQVYLSAKNISGPVDRLYLQVEGFPNETLFSKGNVSQNLGGDEVLFIEQDDFGSVNMTLPKGFSGGLSLEITAFSEEENKTQQQRRIYTVYIEPQFTFDIKACLSENRTESVAEIRVDFNFTETNMSGLIDIVIVPPYLKLSKGQAIEFGRFQLTDADLGDILYVQSDLKYSNIQSIEISLDFTVFDSTKSHWKVHHKGRTIKCLCNSDCKTTTITQTMETTTQTVEGRITTLKVIFDYDIPTQDDLNDISIYEKYRNEIKAVLTQLFQIKLGGHLQNINILYITHGSLIVEFEIITDATMDSTSQLSASLVSLQSMHLLGRKSSLMSVTFLDNNVTVKGDNNLNECTFNMYINPCKKNNECQVENGLPVCREVVSEVKLFSLDATTEAIVLGSMGGLFGLIVLIFIICMICYICRQKKETKKPMHHPRHKDMAQTQETEFNRLTLTSTPTSA
ncbi:hypothetical protein ACJMK2_033916 [Sinanodonta woodiana]|uniref:EGF-like domain-containing protein n=1 Tax=Sinanodonta woodiana TaxID=1069815 RepID=A0ABD3WPY3_SINWO